ncbi:molybdopterin-dependent oxidoreductase [Clostridia bacterium]|nr:molybdopterin-dependent oxidoreductase [Clostridia bacterium]
MFKMKKSWVSVLCLLAIVLLVAGCSQPTANEEESMGSFTVTGIGDERVISVADIIEQYDAVEMDVTSVDSAGETNEYHVKGVRLADVLAGEGISAEDYSSMRAVAGDGYAIEVPQEIVEIRDIVLAYEMDGEALPEDSKPIRLIVPEERSMYWVRNMATLDLMQTKQVVETTKIVFLDTAVADLTQEPYTYYDSEDMAVSMTELLATYGVEGSDDIYFVSADGLEKEETRDNVELGYLKITGEDTPLFLSPDLPKGMHIKQVLSFSQPGISFYSLESGFASQEIGTIDKFEGISLQEIAGLTGLKEASSYLLTARDGYSVSVEADYFNSGIIYFKDGTYRSVFPDLDKATKVKEILSIEAE